MAPIKKLSLGILLEVKAFRIESMRGLLSSPAVFAVKV
jgi:hypothetical protein